METITAQDPSPRPSSLNCLICNLSFPYPSSSNLHLYIHEKQELGHSEHVFFYVFNVPTDKQDKLSFSNKPNAVPFCSNCTPIVRDFVKAHLKYRLLKAQLYSIGNKVSQVISNSFKDTLTNFDYFPLKSEIFRQISREKNKDSLENISSDTLSRIQPTNIVIPEQSSNQEKSKRFGISRELFMLKKKDKWDKMIISVDQENTEEITCVICEKICRSKENLETHMKVHEITRFDCEACGKFYHNIYALKKHISTKHVDGCSDCPSENTLLEMPGPSSSIDEDMSFPSLSTSLNCLDDVNASAIQTQPVQNDILASSSTKDPELPTPIINDKNRLDKLPATQDKSLIQHHTNQKILNIGSQCEDCGKKFRSRATLRRHIRAVHNESMKLKCPFCSLTTRDHFNLSKHVATHDSSLTRIIYNCGYCGAGATTKRNFTVHLAELHPRNLIPQPIIRAIREDEDPNIKLSAEQQLPLTEFEPIPPEILSTIVTLGHVDLENVPGGMAEFQMPVLEAEARDHSQHDPNHEVVSSRSSPSTASPGPSVLSSVAGHKRRRFIKKRSELFSVKRRKQTNKPDVHPISINQEAVEPLEPRYRTIKLCTVSNSILNGPEVDRLILREAQQRYSYLQNMNFDLKLILEKWLPPPVKTSTSHWHLLKEVKKNSLSNSSETFRNPPGESSSSFQPSSSMVKSIPKEADLTENWRAKETSLTQKKESTLSFLHSNVEPNPVANVKLPDNWRQFGKNSMILKTPGPKSTQRLSTLLDEMLSKPVNHQKVSLMSSGNLQTKWSEFVGFNKPLSGTYTTSTYKSVERKVPTVNVQNEGTKPNSSYWADASNIIKPSGVNATHAQFDPALSTDNVRVSPGLQPPQSKLTSIGKSLKQYPPTTSSLKKSTPQPKRAQNFPKFGAILKPNVKPETRDGIKTGESPHIIESTVSLAPPQVASVTNRKAMQSQVSSEAAALLKNTKLSVSVSNQSEKSLDQAVSSGSHNQPKSTSISIPPGIKLVSVEQVLQGKTSDDSISRYGAVGKLILPKPSSSPQKVILPKTIPFSGSMITKQSAITNHSTNPVKTKSETKKPSMNPVPIQPSQLIKSNVKELFDSPFVNQTSEDDYEKSTIRIQSVQGSYSNVANKVDKPGNINSCQSVLNHGPPQHILISNTVPVSQSGSLNSSSNQPIKIVLAKKVITPGPSGGGNNSFINPNAQNQIRPGNRRYKTHEMASVMKYTEFLQNKNVAIANSSPNLQTFNLGTNTNSVVAFLTPISISQGQIITPQTFTTNTTTTPAPLAVPITLVPTIQSIQPQSTYQLQQSNVNPFI